MSTAVGTRGVIGVGSGQETRGGRVGSLAGRDMGGGRGGELSGRVLKYSPLLGWGER